MQAFIGFLEVCAHHIADSGKKVQGRIIGGGGQCAITIGRRYMM